MPTRYLAFALAGVLLLVLAFALGLVVMLALPEGAGLGYLPLTALFFGRPLSRRLRPVSDRLLGRGRDEPGPA